MRLLALLFGTALTAGLAFAQEEPAEVVSTDPRVNIVTSAGSFVIELDVDRAPLTVENFLAYAREGHYDGTIFHRVIQGFVAQSGGYTGDFQLKPTERMVVNEGGRQRTEQSPRYGRARAHLRPALGKFAVLHQPGRQPGPEPAPDPLGLRGVRHRGRGHGRRGRDRPRCHRRQRPVRAQRAGAEHSHRTRRGGRRITWRSINLVWNMCKSLICFSLWTAGRRAALAVFNAVSVAAGSVCRCCAP